MQTHKQKTASRAQKVTGTLEKQAPDPTTPVRRENLGCGVTHTTVYS